MELFKPADWAAWCLPEKWKYPTRYYRVTGQKGSAKEYQAWASVRARADGRQTVINAATERRRLKYLSLSHCPQLQVSYDLFIETLGPAPNHSASIDRIDNDRGYWLDNIKWSSRLEQALNRSMPVTNTAGFRGVGPHSSPKKPWKSKITIQATQYSLGYFRTPEDAARAYDAIYYEWYGITTGLNFPEEYNQRKPI